MSDQLMLLPPSAAKQPQRVKKRGHADQPGTGPAGETCGSCLHIAKRHLGKTYTKCALARENWTCGSGTDIRHKDAACSFWKSAK